MNERDSQPEGMTRREAIKKGTEILGLIMFGSGIGSMTQLAAAGYGQEQRANFEKHIGGEEGVPIEKAKELDVIIDETLIDKNKIEECIKGTVAEMKEAGATDEQIDQSIKRYIEYANARLTFIMNESFDRIKAAEGELTK